MCCMNRTSSMPKSVLCYDVDKDLTSFWNSVFTQSCSPNKETDSRRRVKQVPASSFMQPCSLHTHITHVCICRGSIWHHINTLPQAGFDPLKQREDCYQSTTLPPSHHGWIRLKQFCPRYNGL